MKLRTKLRKEKELQELELDKIETKIVESQINLLLAKINYVVNKDVLIYL